MPSCRLLQRDAGKGPLLLMVVRMCGDVVNFLLLLAGPLIGFAAAFTPMYKGDLGALGSDECAAFEAGVLSAPEIAAAMCAAGAWGAPGVGVSGRAFSRAIEALRADAATRVHVALPVSDCV